MHMPGACICVPESCQVQTQLSSDRNSTPAAGTQASKEPAAVMRNRIRPKCGLMPQRRSLLMFKRMCQGQHRKAQILAVAHKFVCENMKGRIHRPSPGTATAAGDPTVASQPAHVTAQIIAVAQKDVSGTAWADAFTGSVLEQPQQQLGGWGAHPRSPHGSGGTGHPCGWR